MRRLLALLALLIAVIIMQIYVPHEPSEAPTTASLFAAMLDYVDSAPGGSQVHYDKVAIGYNTNSDLVVDAIPVMNQLGVSNPPSGNVHDSISTPADLAELVAHFMASGSAVERVITNYEACKAIVGAARSIPGTCFAFVGLLPIHFFRPPYLRMPASCCGP